MVTGQLVDEQSRKWSFEILTQIIIWWKIEIIYCAKCDIEICSMSLKCAACELTSLQTD